MYPKASTQQAPRLDVIVEDEVVATVALQQRQCPVDAEVLKLQHRLRVALRDRRHELVEERVVLLVRQPRLVEAEV